MSLANFHATFKNNGRSGDSDDYFLLYSSYLPSAQRSKQTMQAKADFSVSWSLPWSCPGNSVARLLSSDWYNSEITTLCKHSGNVPLVLRCPVLLLAPMVAASCFCRHCPELVSIYIHVVLHFAATLSGQNFRKDISTGQHPTFSLSPLCFLSLRKENYDQETGVSSNPFNCQLLFRRRA